MPFSSTSDFLYIPISIAILLAVWFLLQIHSKSMANQLVRLLKRQPAPHKLIVGHINNCSIPLHKQSVSFEQSPIAKKLGFPSDCEIVKVLISNSSQTQARSFSRHFTPNIELKNGVHKHASAQAHLTQSSNPILSQQAGKCLVLKTKNTLINSMPSSKYGKAANQELTRAHFLLPECLNKEKKIVECKLLSIICSNDFARSITNLPLLSLQEKCKKYGGKIELQFNNSRHIKLPHTCEVGIANTHRAQSSIQYGFKVSYISKINSRNAAKPIVLLGACNSKLKLNSKYSVNLSKFSKKCTAYIGVDCNFSKLSKQKLGCLNIGDGSELSTGHIEFNTSLLARG
jgi:hypothetical protein